MIVEIKMISIGTAKITPKNRSELVFFGCVDRKRPVLGGPVWSPQYLGRSWTGFSPRLRVLGTKNRTEPDLKTLPINVHRQNSSLCRKFAVLYTPTAFLMDSVELSSAPAISNGSSGQSIRIPSESVGIHRK
jgi:hypothetical protein